MGRTISWQCPKCKAEFNIHPSHVDTSVIEQPCHLCPRCCACKPVMLLAQLHRAQRRNRMLEARTRRLVGLARLHRSCRGEMGDDEGGVCDYDTLSALSLEIAKEWNARIEADLAADLATKETHNA